MSKTIVYEKLIPKVPVPKRRRTKKEGCSQLREGWIQSWGHPRFAFSAVANEGGRAASEPPEAATRSCRRSSV
jgi:hypothetical protein